MWQTYQTYQTLKNIRLYRQTTHTYTPKENQRNDNMRQPSRNSRYSYRSYDPCRAPASLSSCCCTSNSSWPWHGTANSFIATIATVATIAAIAGKFSASAPPWLGWDPFKKCKEGELASWLSSLDNSHPHGPVPADPQHNEATKVQQREGFEVPLPLFFLRFWPVLRFCVRSKEGKRERQKY